MLETSRDCSRSGTDLNGTGQNGTGQNGTGQNGMDPNGMEGPTREQIVSYQKKTYNEVPTQASSAKTYTETDAQIYFGDTKLPDGYGA
jgi:hypothetical protein